MMRRLCHFAVQERRCLASDCIFSAGDLGTHMLSRWSWVSPIRIYIHGVSLGVFHPGTIGSGCVKYTVPLNWNSACGPTALVMIQKLPEQCFLAQEQRLPQHSDCRSQQPLRHRSSAWGPRTVPLAPAQRLQSPERHLWAQHSVSHKALVASTRSALWSKKSACVSTASVVLQNGACWFQISDSGI